MKRVLSILTLLLIASLTVVACAKASDTDTGTGDTSTGDTDTGDMDTGDTDTGDMDTGDAAGGLSMGMSAEELEAAGYVVVAPGEPIRIGASAALTGPIPEFGLDISQAYQVAVADLNEAGGLLGHEYELDIQDGACDGDAATVVANGFAADPSIVAVAGGTCTGETLGLSPILQEARIPFVTSSATNPAITSEDCDTCNRIPLSDKLQADVDAAYIYSTLGITTIAIMHDNSDYGLGVAELVEAAFELEGGSVVGFEGIQVGDTDFRSALTLVANESPGLIFFGGYTTEAGLIAAQMKETGLEDALFFGPDGIYGSAFLDAAGDAANGSYASFVVGDEVEDANLAFDAKYEEMFGVAPDDQGPYHAHAYDSVMMIANAIASVAVEDDNGEGYLIIDREALITAIRSTSGLGGLTGTLTCNAIGDCGAGGIQIFTVQDGAFVQVSGFGLEE